mmetsp:Transcript_92878/g.267198  ORF Transcript_92878/g.267198 Transcript_92878/m.267198 type:complete len:209 (+) Transcript_92878:1333-1959(+)
MSDVPLKSAWMRCLPKGSTNASGSEPGPISSFICGTDSPVSVASLTMALPRRIKQSHGTVRCLLCSFSFELAASSVWSCLSGFFATNEITSPGRRSSMGFSDHAPRRKTCTLKLFVLMPRRVDIDLRRWKAVEASKPSTDNSVKAVYFQYVSSIHSAVQKNWKIASGAVSCFLNSCKNVGRGRSKTFVPNLSCALSISPSVANPLALR